MTKINLIKNSSVIFLIFIASLLSITLIYAVTLSITGEANIFNTSDTLNFDSDNSNVTIDSNTGIFSGYAFMDDLGWVEFGSVDNVDGPVIVNTSTGEVTGAARVLNTGNLIDFDASNSNVVMDLDTQEFSGFVFSEDVGWIDFSNPGVIATEMSGPPNVGSPQTVSTFNSISIYWNPPSDSAAVEANVEFRETGSTNWIEGYPLWYNSNDDRYTGSLVHLKSGTTYEIHLELDGISEQATFTADTWDEEFPIGSTVYLPENSDETLNITTSGTPTGYVLYTFAPGSSATIDVLNLERNNIVIDASYIIIRGLTLKGAQRDAIHIYPTNSHDIVIEENDISDWGNIKYPLTGFGENSEAAIRANTSPNVNTIIIQRNTMHHPRPDTNSWGETRPDVTPTSSGTHPVGPQAIYLFQSGGNHVIRYNTIYSDDDHRFNDCIGGGSNSTSQGFPYKDSDIYGNYMSHCWDNGIEAEGGNQNIRIWGNYMDQTYRAIANRDTRVGPLYVWRNITNISRKHPDTVSSWTTDPRGSMGKTGGESATEQGVFYFHNTALQPAVPGESVTGGVSFGIDGPMQHTKTRNNIFQTFCTTSSCDAIKLTGGAVTNDFDYDLFNKAVAISGAETNGILGSPTYADPSGLDPDTHTGIFSLDSSSNGFDDGEIIPNFNSQLIRGTAPDMGAHEDGVEEMQFGVNAYLDGEPYTVSSIEPTGSIIINSGDSYTNSLSAALALTASDDLNGSSELQMIISENADFSGASYESFLSSTVINLTSSDGVKTVYIKFKDTNGLESIAYSDTITLDRTLPTTPGTPSTTTPTNDLTPTWTWTASTDSGSGLEIPAYTMQWSQTSDFSGGVTTSTINTNNFTHSINLTEGTWYFRVKSTDIAMNESAYSTAGSVIIDNTNPTTPGTPSATTPTSDTTPSWTWTASTDSGSGLANPAYTVEWSQTSDFSGGVTSATTNTNNFTHPVALAEGTWYLRVRAQDLVNNLSSFSANGIVVIDTSSPTTPGTPTTATPTNDTTPTWTWTASTDSGSGLENPAYTLEWSQSSTFSSGVTSSTINTSAFTHSSSLSQGTWYFRVRAEDLVGNDSSFSSNGSVVIDTTAPTTPGTPSPSTSITDTTPTWTWTASTDVTGLANPAYTVEWSQSSTFSAGVGSSTTNTNSFTHSIALAEGTWYFRVKASDLASNQSSFSSNGTITLDTANPTTPGTPATGTPTNDTTRAWSWTASTDAGSGLANPAYSIEWSQSSTFSSAVTSSTTNSNSFTHSTVLSEGVWYFRVKASDVAGNQSSFSANGSVAIDTTVPTTPGTPSATTPTSDTTPNWTWTASTDFTGLGNPAYLIDWSQSATFSSGVNTSSSSTNSFTHSLALASGTWYIRVKAVDAVENQSGYSSTGSIAIAETVTPPASPPVVPPTTPPAVTPPPTTPTLLPPTVVPPSSDTPVTEPLPSSGIEKSVSLKIQILDTDGNPIEGVSVTFYASIVEGTTDISGNVYFDNVIVGSHKIVIEYGDYREIKDIQVTDSNLGSIAGENIIIKIDTSEANLNRSSGNNTLAIVIVIFLIGVVSISLYFLLRKRDS